MVADDDVPVSPLEALPVVAASVPVAPTLPPAPLVVEVPLVPTLVEPSPPAPVDPLALLSGTQIRCSAANSPVVAISPLVLADENEPVEPFEPLPPLVPLGGAAQTLCSGHSSSEVHVVVSSRQRLVGVQSSAQLSSSSPLEQMPSPHVDPLPVLLLPGSGSSSHA
ncbi:MAG TPA: hypothetical protein VGB13_01180 [Candidatus Krumholzibacteria bacterium]